MPVNFTTEAEPVTENIKVPDYFFVKQGVKLIKVFWKNVYHLEAIKNYVKIKSTEHSSAVLISGSLQQVLQLMIPSNKQNLFVKINWAEAIAKSSITKVEKDSIETSFGIFKVSIEFDKKYL